MTTPHDDCDPSRSEAIEAAAELRHELIQDKALGEALGRLRDPAVVYVPNPGNVGDGLIAMGAYHLLDALGIDPTVVPSNDRSRLAAAETIVLGGGGGLIEGIYNEPFGLARKHLEAGGELIVLPSTVLGHEAFFERHADRVTIFARETTTFARLTARARLAEHVHLSHDLAFALDPAFYEDQRDRRGQGVLNSLRADSEGMSSCASSPDDDIQLFFNGHLWHDRELCAQVMALYAAYLSGFERLNTDRVHLSVFGALLARETAMHPNSYHKNRSIYEFSLRRFPNICWQSEHRVSELSMPRGNGPEAGNAARGQPLPPMTSNQFRWEAMREHAVHFEAENGRLQRANTELETEKREKWEPELARLTAALAEAQAQLASAEQAQAAQNADFAVQGQYLAELRKTKDEWWEPELGRLTAALAEAQAALASTEQLLAARDAAVADQERRLAEILQTKETWWDPEIVRLTNELEAASAHGAELTEALASARAAQARAEAEADRQRTGLQYARRSLDDAEKRRRREVEAHEASLLRVSELEHLIESWFKPELDRVSAVADARERRLGAALIEAATGKAAAAQAVEESLRQQAAAAEALNAVRLAEAEALRAAADAQAALSGLQGTRGYRVVAGLSRVRRSVAPGREAPR